MNFVRRGGRRKHGAATIGIRPEHLSIAGDGEGWQGTVSVAEHLGSDTFLYVDAAELGMLTARCIGELDLKRRRSRVGCRPIPRRIHRSSTERRSADGACRRSRMSGRRLQSKGREKSCIWKNSSSPGASPS